MPAWCDTALAALLLSAVSFYSTARASLPKEAPLFSFDKKAKNVAIAKHPFDNARGDADVVLQSAEETKFYVHSAVLRIASSFFDDMLSLPQPKVSEAALANPDSGDGSALPVMPMTENTETLNVLLRMCYPVQKPAFFNIPSLSLILGAALKYEMTEATDVLTKHLVSTCRSCPLQVFAEACIHNLEDVARRAAQAFCATMPHLPTGSDCSQWTNIPVHAISEYAEHMDSIPASSYYQLLQYYIKCSALHILIPVPSITNEATDDNMVNVPENSSTLATLLQLCYPLPDPVIETEMLNGDRLNDACVLLEAANKYKITRAQEFAKRACIEASAGSSLRLYFIALRYDWKDVVAESAMRAVYELTDVYVPELEAVRAAEFRRLLIYRQKCRSVILSKWYNSDVTQRSAQRSDAQAEYWSERPWLDKTGEAHFWMTVHSRAQEQVTHAESQVLDAGSILPSSTIHAPLTHPPSNSPKSNATRTAKRISNIRSGTSSAGENEVDDVLLGRQIIITQIAEDLMKLVWKQASRINLKTGPTPALTSILEACVTSSALLPSFPTLRTIYLRGDNMTTTSTLGASPENPTSMPPTPSTSVDGKGSKAEATIASAPFDNPYHDADVIFRSADKTDFYVHRAVLRMASPYFADMFSLPQPSSTDASNAGSSARGNTMTDDSKDGLPTIPVTEHSRILEGILRMCYPIEKHSLSSVQKISPILEGTLKYQMIEPTGALKAKLTSLYASQPLDVFAEAYYRGLEDVAKEAAGTFVKAKAKGKRSHTIDEFSPYMGAIPASLYFRLLEYYSGVSPSSTTEIPEFSLCPTSVTLPNEIAGPNDKSSSFPHPFNDSSCADAVIRSSDGVEFRVARAFVSFSSSKLKDKLSQEPTSSDAPTAALPCVDLPETGRILAPLLQLCYPMPDPSVDGAPDGSDDQLQVARRLFQAATKYEVTRAVEFAKRLCVAAMPIYPVRGRMAIYVPEMEIASAAVYRRLLVYRQKCRNSVLARYIMVRGEPAGTKYWSKDSWLSEPSDAEFWSVVHERVYNNVKAGREPCITADGLFPISIQPAEDPASVMFGLSRDQTQSRTLIKLSIQAIIEAAKALAQDVMRPFTTTIELDTGASSLAATSSAHAEVLNVLRQIDKVTTN
ncbi:hypothetical protein DAEQUDRAFT_739106 [Daedalea quercina L-15889]|uniref:BTB domain-containing protein n=1 Tax=Daedalea quercina L-15889 TaxID=1314783 RepID=A0A165P7E1_9APHY|nr:hypothetical protein DAEQUDRAFT_739106 [Daedalea quercina L-15889]